MIHLQGGWKSQWDSPARGGVSPVLSVLTARQACLQKPAGGFFHWRSSQSCCCSQVLLPPHSPEPTFLPSLVSPADMSSLKEICSGLPLHPMPENRGRKREIPHAPVRTPNLTAQEEKVMQLSAGPGLPSPSDPLCSKQQSWCPKCFSKCGLPKLLAIK